MAHLLNNLLTRPQYFLYNNTQGCCGFSFKDKVLHLNPLGVEVFIDRTRSNNIDPYWDNYDLIVWKKDISGFSNIKGMFRKNSWGVAEKFSITKNGTWVLPKKYVRYFKQPWRRPRRL